MARLLHQSHADSFPSSSSLVLIKLQIMVAFLDTKLKFQVNSNQLSQFKKFKTD